MADDGERPPAENPRFLQFLKRGEGSKKYSQINYMKPKYSTGSQIHPSATSESSGYPSTSAYADVDIHPARKIPPLQLSPPVVVPDSGRGSAAPQEQIYAMPSNRSVESGYGGYIDSQVPSPDRTGEEVPESDTIVNDYSQDIQPSQHGQELTNRTTDDEVFLPNDNNNNAYRSPALESFVRHEQAIEGQMDENTEMSTPTRELRIRAASRELDNYYASDSSVGHHRITDHESINTNDGPLSSTPIHAVPFEHVEQPVVLPQPAPRHVRIQGTTPKETPILGEMTSSEPHSELSSPTTVDPTFKPSSDESSLSSTRKLIAKNDRPLKEAFPEQNHAFDPKTPVPRPSQSTQYQARHVAAQPSPPTEDHLRRAALNNQRSRRQAAVPSPTSSEDVHTTPLRKLIPKTTDPVVKILRRQLRDNVAHVDLGCSNLHDGFKKLAKVRQMYVEKEAHLDYALQQAEKEREEANNHIQKELDNLRKDRLNLERREKEFQKLQAERDKENKDQLVTAGAQVATQRHIVRCKDKQISDLKAELEAKDDMKARLEKTLEMQKNNHLREIKKYQNEIADLQKRLSLAETMATKKRVGLQPRNTAKPLQQSHYDHSLPLPEPENEPVFDSQQRAQSFNYGQPPDLSKKQVQFDLGKNVVYNHFSQPDMANFYKFSPLPPMTVGTVGTCHPYRNEDKNEITYLYDLKHGDGHECGAKIFKYPTNDAKWIYGPIEVYLCHKFPLIVHIRCIDVEIRVFSKTTEIHRENLEVSALDRESEMVTEVMRRKDRAGYYAARYSARTKTLTAIYGTSDSPAEEDQIALRRGVLSDKREYLQLGSGKQGYEVHWINEKIPSAQVKQYRVVSVGIGMTKITVGLQTETIDITACPEKDWIIIRHDVNGSKTACCDLGKPSRDREREGVFTASGKHSLELLPVGSPFFNKMLLVFFLSSVESIPPDPLAYPNHISLRCPWAHFDCDTKSPAPFCIPFTYVRNCVKDCPNGADEWCGMGQIHCDVEELQVTSKNFKCGQCVLISEQAQKCSDRRWANMCRDPRTVKCATTPNCVLPQWLQDGKDDCGDGSDEDPCGTGIVACPAAPEPLTSEIVMLLDNITDAETDNSTLTSTQLTFPEQCETGEYRCGSGECIEGKRVLNEKKDCADGSDEDYCIRFGSECRMDSRPCSYQPDIASFGCGCPRGNTRTEQGICIPK